MAVREPKNAPATRRPAWPTSEATTSRASSDASGDGARPPCDHAGGTTRYTPSDGATAEEVFQQLVDAAGESRSDKVISVVGLLWLTGIPMGGGDARARVEEAAASVRKMVADAAPPHDVLDVRTELEGVDAVPWVTLADTLAAPDMMEVGISADAPAGGDTQPLLLHKEKYVSRARLEQLLEGANAAVAAAPPGAPGMPALERFARSVADVIETLARAIAREFAAVSASLGVPTASAADAARSVTDLSSLLALTDDDEVVALAPHVAAPPVATRTTISVYGNVAVRGTGQGATVDVTTGDVVTVLPRAVVGGAPQSPPPVDGADAASWQKVEEDGGAGAWVTFARPPSHLGTLVGAVVTHAAPPAARPARAGLQRAAVAVAACAGCDAALSSAVIAGVTRDARVAPMFTVAV